ncbi:MAG: ABC transporter ATP-binding protein [Brevinematia bacterium]
MKLLEAKNISINYGGHKAVKDASFEILENEIVAFIGANGAGKSTLLKSIVGLVPLKTGSITFDRKPIRSAGGINFTTDNIVKMGISLVPEGRKIFGDLSVRENLEMGAYIIKERKKIEDRLEFVYSLFPILKDRQRQRAGLLSGGEQQMLSISRALMSYPKLLLLDEPSLGLAPFVVKDIFAILKKINKEEKVSICLVEQNAKLALKISKRGYVIETGEIIFSDESEKLLMDPKVKSAYLGEG